MFEQLVLLLPILVPSAIGLVWLVYGMISANHYISIAETRHRYTALDYLSHRSPLHGDASTLMVMGPWGLWLRDKNGKLPKWFPVSSDGSQKRR